MKIAFEKKYFLKIFSKRGLFICWGFFCIIFITNQQLFLRLKTYFFFTLLQPCGISLLTNLKRSFCLLKKNHTYLINVSLTTKGHFIHRTYSNSMQIVGNINIYYYYIALPIYSIMYVYLILEVEMMIYVIR